MFKQIQSLAMASLVILISVVFVLQFGGPQADGCVASGIPYVAKVHGVLITEGDFNAAYRMANYDQQPPAQQERYDLRNLVLLGMIETQLLAREARSLGYGVEAVDVMRNLAENGTAYFRLGINAPPGFAPPNGQMPVPVRDRDGRFDEEYTRNWIQHRLNRSIAEFQEMQIQTALAQRMIETVLSTVELSPSELWDAYSSEQERAQIKYVMYSPAFFADTLDITPEAVSAWAAEHQDEINQAYESEQSNFSDLDEQVRARHILIDSPESESEEDRAAARARAEELLAELRAGADFIELARQHSDDLSNALRGGDLGWLPRGRRVAAFDEALFATEVGALSDVVETRYGYHVIKVIDRREGDIPEADAKAEIAERLYREARGQELAEEAAAAALQELGGELSMDELQARLRPSSEVAEGEEPAVPDWRLRHRGAPTVAESRLFGRGDSVITGPFNSSSLNLAVFEMEEVGALPEEPAQLGENLVVYQLASRERATRDGFTDEIRQRLTQGLMRTKSQEVVRQYIARLTAEARADGALNINRSLLESDDEDDDESDEDSSEAEDSAEE